VRNRFANIDLLYLLAVLVSALTGGRRPAIVTAIASVLVFDYVFVGTRFTVASNAMLAVVKLIMFVIVAVVTSGLAARASRLAAERAQAEARILAKDEILRRVSHELRSPLTGVMGWTQHLDRLAGDRQGLTRGLSGLHHNATLLARLVDDLMDASRISSHKLSIRLTDLAPTPIVTRVVDGMRPAADERGVAIDLDVQPVGHISGDEQRLDQIVRNLVSNAIKFTPRGGRVSVRLARGSAGTGIELTINDTGVGIPPEFLPSIFEAFTQASADHVEGGLGLGLSIVKHLVEAHGGTIAATSPGANLGATFVVRLPCPAATAAGGDATAIPFRDEDVSVTRAGHR
jgi:signal transduction histidine kinase